MKKIYFYFIVLTIFTQFFLSSCKNSLPVISINNPLTNTSFIGGQSIDFKCSVIDDEDVIFDSTKVVWSSDKDGEIGRGFEFSKNNLSVNNHIITVKATDSKGETAISEINIIITPNEFSFGIVTPNNNFEIFEGEKVNFSCNPVSLNGNIVDLSKVIWNSDKDGIIGTGKNFEIDSLSANNHKITLKYDGEIVFSQDFNILIKQDSVNLILTDLAYNQYYKGYNINFSCNASNLSNSTFNEQNVIWTSDKDGIIGTGFSFSKSNLSINTHQISVIAENEFGRSDEKTFTLTITNDKANFELLLTRMCGYFSSQAHADTTTNQYIVDVRLHMAQIWDDRNVGENIYWLYVEQAYADNLQSPYRQRIYKVILDPDGKIHDDIYSITSAATYKQGYLNPDIFDNLTMSGLVLKEDCGLTFILNNQNIFEGATSGNGCPATIPGLPQVKYITSVSTIADNYLTSWDRGYSATGAWLMGPDWPYIFDKLENYNFVSSK